MEKQLDFLKKIDWWFFWEITKDYIFPSIGTLIWNIVLFFVISIIVSIAYTIILSRKKVLKRIPRYYNWAVKLYVPLLFVGIIYIFFQIGMVRGFYKILDNNRPVIVENIYNESVSHIFKSNTEKNEFINEVQEIAKETQDGAKEFSLILHNKVNSYNSGNNIIDKGKDKLASYLLDIYSEDIYTLVVYGMLNSAPHVNITEAIPYDEFNTIFDVLLSVDHKNLEQSIIRKIDTWCSDLLYSQYKSLLITNLILLVIVMIIPLIEFFIYKMWIEKKWIDKKETKV